MNDLVHVLAAISAWYVGTGALAWMNRRSPDLHRLSLAAGLVLVGAGVAGIEVSRAAASPSGAYVAFGSAFLLWAWLEMSYLMGLITGPEKRPCPAELRGWARFHRAVNLSLHHELTVILTGAAVLWACWGAANTVAAWTFVTLWLMRWSAKLNLYLGVANFDPGLLPERLRYLASYMASRPINALFPVSVTVGAGLCGLHGLAALQADPGSFARVAWLLVGTITALAVIEHWLMVLPIKDSRLWRWALQ